MKLEVAEQTAKDARSQGHATTGAMLLGVVKWGSPTRSIPLDV